MAESTYSAQVDRDVADTKAKLLAVHKEAVQRQVEDMQTPVGAGGNLRVDTGFLRASLKAAVGQANFAMTAPPDGEAVKFSYDAGEVTLIIAQAQIEDAIEVVYTANYALAREFGARGQPGDRWVALAGQRWQQNVEGVVADLKARSGGTRG